MNLWVKGLSLLHLPDSATLAGPFLGLGWWERSSSQFSWFHYLEGRRACSIGLTFPVLSYWGEWFIDRNRPGLLRSELRSRRTVNR